MAAHLYKLGDLVFSADDVPLNELSRQTEYRWALRDRLLRRPVHQWIGLGVDNVTLHGTIYPGYNPFRDGRVIGVGTVEEARGLAAQGVPYEFTDGMGGNYGRWVMKSITERASHMLDNGAPRKQEFTMEISRYGEDEVGERSIIYDKQRGIFTAPRIPSQNASPGAGSPAIIASPSALV